MTLILQFSGPLFLFLGTLIIGLKWNLGIQGHFSFFKSQVEYTSVFGGLGLAQALFYLRGNGQISKKNHLIFSLIPSITVCFFAVISSIYMKLKMLDVVYLTVLSTLNLVYNNLRYLSLSSKKVTPYTVMTSGPQLIFFLYVLIIPWPLLNSNSSLTAIFCLLASIYISGLVIYLIYEPESVSLQKIDLRVDALPVKKVLMLSLTYWATLVMSSFSLFFLMSTGMRNLEPDQLGLLSTYVLLTQSLVVPLNIVMPIIFRSLISNKGSLSKKLSSPLKYALILFASFIFILIIPQFATRIDWNLFPKPYLHLLSLLGFIFATAMLDADIKITQLLSFTGENLYEMIATEAVKLVTLLVFCLSIQTYSFTSLAFGWSASILASWLLYMIINCFLNKLVSRA